MLRKGVNMDRAKFAKNLPMRNAHVHKYSRGRACVIGGSSKFPGAVMMAAKSAARAGAGYVSLFVPSGIKTTCQIALPSIVTSPLPCTPEGNIGKGAFEFINTNKQHCVLYGPGAGSGKTQEKLLRKLLQTDLTLVVDADMIAKLSDLENAFDAQDFYSRKAPLVLTPHHAELKHWLQDNREDDYNKLESCVIAFRVQEKMKLLHMKNTVVVAKGEKTIVITPTDVFEPACGTETLATAGTGDVLAGCICGLIAQKQPSSLKKTAKLCAAAVEVHALAGEIAGKEFGQRGALATDVCENIGIAVDALMNLSQLSWNCKHEHCVNANSCQTAYND